MDRSITGLIPGGGSCVIGGSVSDVIGGSALFVQLFQPSEVVRPVLRNDVVAPRCRQLLPAVRIGPQRQVAIRQALCATFGREIRTVRGSHDEGDVGVLTGEYRKARRLC